MADRSNKSSNKNIILAHSLEPNNTKPINISLMTKGKNNTEEKGDNNK